MTVLTRWDPFREFTTLQERMNRLVRDQYRAEGGSEESLTTTNFAPPVDVYEDEHSITLKIEVPGIDEKDIDVRIENNTLTVHGERNFERKRRKRTIAGSSGSMAASLAASHSRAQLTLTTSRPTMKRAC